MKSNKIQLNQCVAVLSYDEGKKKSEKLMLSKKWLVWVMWTLTSNISIPSAFAELKKALTQLYERCTFLTVPSLTFNVHCSREIAYIKMTPVMAVKDSGTQDTRVPFKK